LIGAIASIEANRAMRSRFQLVQIEAPFLTDEHPKLASAILR